MAATASSIDDRIEGRLDTLRTVLTNDHVKKLPLAPIRFLSALLLEGDLRNLKFDRDTDPTSSGVGQPGSVQSMEVVTSPGLSLYRVSHQTRTAMESVASNEALNEQDFDWMIDNYFIHELLHNAQGMSGGNHSELGRQAPRVLLDVDYQADALAAVTATALAWLVPTEFGFSGSPPINENHWTLYERAVRAILNQMEIFTLIGNWGMKRDDIAMARTSLERILRIATWHYQLHRLRGFRPSRPLADFQILAQPVLDFRNLAWAAVFEPDALCRDWPVRERAIVAHWSKSRWLRRKPIKGRLFPLEGRPPLVVAVATPLGTTRFVRHHSPNPRHYEDAFAGIFLNRARRSRELFTSLFAVQPWLTGGSDASAYTYDWMNLPKDRVDHFKATAGLAPGTDIDQRAKVLTQFMRPSRSQIISSF